MRNRTIVAIALALAAALLLAGIVAAAPAPGKPALITSAGQSTDGLILRTILTDRATGESVPFEKLATPENLQGVRTLIVAVGLSSKGLGAAGVNQDQERERVANLLDAAKANDVYVILVHIGGTARRGAGSDEFSSMVAEYAHQIFVVKAGNDDGFFNKLAEARGIPVTEVNDRTALGPILTELLAGN
ncbi:MAG: hypothetical protein GX183_04335 [Firmicutes bacterium]|nr:hypothetical protein [Bacillota bacterium]